MSLCRHKPPYDTHLGVVINRTKFDVRTPSSLGGIKTHTDTLRGRIALCCIGAQTGLQSAKLQVQ